MRVLLVEDEPRLAETVQRGLELAGFAVQWAHTGPDGLRWATASAFDAIVLDTGLAGLGGYEVLRRIRQRDKRTPVLLLTTSEGAPTPDSPAEAYLAKPFPFTALLARVRTLLLGPSVPRQTVFTIGDLTMDTVRHSVRRGDVAVDLTPREYGLLEFLLRQGGRVVTKSEILHGVWDAQYAGPENVVEVYIGYLRKKIDVPFGRSTIRTRRGAGYQLVAD